MNHHDLTDRQRRKWSAELRELITLQQTTAFTDEQRVRRIWETTRTAHGLLKRETIDRGWIPVGATR